MSVNVEVQDAAYRGASFTAREMSSWLTGIASADAELLPERQALVGRARDLERNHGVASGSIQTLVDNIVGTGFTLNARPDYRALGRSKSWADGWAQDTQAAWRSFADSPMFDAARKLNFYGATQLTFRTMVVSGEGLALPLWLPERRSRWATCIQLVDPDRLSTPTGQRDGERMRSGIEIDQYGGAIRYHIRKTHPREIGGYGLNMGLPSDWEAIPAEMEFGRRRVIHVHDMARTGQSRGKPLASVVMPMFRMLDLYERSELQAAVVNAMVAAFIESSAPMPEIAAMLGGSDKYFEARQQHEVHLKGGTVPVLFPGDKMNSFIPSRPNSQFNDFTTSVFRHIGTSMGLPLELLMKDFSKTNYSSARAALLEAWRFFNCRRDALATYWCDPIYNLWLEEAANKGEIQAPDFYANRVAWTSCKWIGDGKGWVDPLKEAEAAKARMEAGVSTLADECAEQGRDWQEVIDQQITEEVYRREARRAAGLVEMAQPASPRLTSGELEQREQQAA